MRRSRTWRISESEELRGRHYSRRFGGRSGALGGKLSDELGVKSIAVKRSLAIVGRLHDKSKVDGNALIDLSSLAGRRWRVVGFVKLGLVAVRALIDLGGDRRVAYVCMSLT